ncbi:META domain-containing protein [Paracoccus ravus]|uniref:META domain-containing protein n=1 Tax=Paracoccus ravus TaxID=2447760 RepID=UPI00106E5A1F|nr:META domain-containing protein [Paracoccus ravus]
MRRLILAAIVSGMGLVAHAETRPVTGDYELVEIEGVTLERGATARLEEDGSIGGQGPCNAFRGPNLAHLPELLYKNVAVTRRACITEGGEAAFLKALGAVRHAKFVGTELVMTGPDVTMRWRPVVK